VCTHTIRLRRKSVGSWVTPMDMTKNAAPHGVSTVRPVVMASHTIISETQRTPAARSEESEAPPCAEFPDCQRGENENSGSNENIDILPEETPFE
jgi:hypothetical protein